MSHLPLLAVVVPLFAAALALFAEHRRFGMVPQRVIAGLSLAVPLLMQYVMQGAASVESRFGFDYVRCIGVGLLVAGLGGIAPLALGYPFLTSGHVVWTLPLVGDLELTSAMVFDTGVYLVVFGGAMLILSMLGTIKPSRTQVARDGVIDLDQRSLRTGEVER